MNFFLLFSCRMVFSGPPIQKKKRNFCRSSLSTMLRSPLTSLLQTRPSTPSHHCPSSTSVAPPSKISHATPDEVAFVVSSLKDRKSPRADKIGNKILRILSKNLISYQWSIIHDVIKLLYFLRSWNLATVICIPKIGKLPQLASNYGPISLFHSISRVTEKIILKRLESTQKITVFFLISSWLQDARL